MNLSTTYLGLALQHPIVASASPLSHTLGGIQKLADAGASAIVMYSLFEEQMGQRLQLAQKYVAHPDWKTMTTCRMSFPTSTILPCGERCMSIRLVWRKTGWMCRSSAA